MFDVNSVEHRILLTKKYSGIYPGLFISLWHFVRLSIFRVAFCPGTFGPWHFVLWHFVPWHYVRDSRLQMYTKD